MKKTVVLAILGIAASATAFGQGGIIFNNSLPDAGSAYYPILWGAGTGTDQGTAVDGTTSGVQLTFWYGKGAGLAADQLSMGPIAAWNTVFEGLGYNGYYNPTVVMLPTWIAGDTYTFQLRATGTTRFGDVDTAASRSVLWQESANIAFIGGTPAGLPGESQNRIALTVSVPEPTTLAMLGLGMAALVTLRRRA